VLVADAFVFAAPVPFEGAGGYCDVVVVDMTPVVNDVDRHNMGVQQKSGGLLRFKTFQKSGESSRF